MSQASQSIEDGSETIALLQEEIARLESELEARDEALRQAFIDAPGHVEDNAPTDLSPRLAELQAELDERDRLIVVLLEEGRSYEEAAEAQRQEWQQLTAWVEEVERRIEQRGQSGPELVEALERERRETDEVRREWVAERRAWESEKATLEDEARQLRDRLATSRSGGVSADAAYLDRENQQLRASLQQAAKHVVLAEEVGPLRNQLALAQAEIDRLAAAHRQEADERRREAIENEAAIRSLQTKLARLAAEQAEPVVETCMGEHGDVTEGYREVDERIRAFRQHLKELHDREEAERSARSLSARLSRLWRHTGPA